MANKLGALSLGKLYGKVRNIGYKLGLVEFKIEDIDLSKIPEIKLPHEYKNWYPEKEKEIKEANLRKDEVIGEVYKYVHKNIL
jgi:hypothetical protein